MVAQDNQGDVFVPLGVVVQNNQRGGTAPPHMNTPYEHANLNTPTNKKNKQKRTQKNFVPNVHSQNVQNNNAVGELFEAFWQAYGRIGNQKPTRLQFKKALKKANFTEIMAGLERYQAYCYQQGRAQKYIMHASTWLRNEGWQDAYIIHENQPQQEITF